MRRPSAPTAVSGQRRRLWAGRACFPYSLCLITVLPYFLRVTAAADDLEPRRPTVNMAANPAYSGKAALPEIDERTGDVNS